MEEKKFCRSAVYGFVLDSLSCAADYGRRIMPMMEYILSMNSRRRIKLQLAVPVMQLIRLKSQQAIPSRTDGKKTTRMRQIVTPYLRRLLNIYELRKVGRLHCYHICDCKCLNRTFMGTESGPDRDRSRVFRMVPVRLLSVNKKREEGLRNHLPEFSYH